MIDNTLAETVGLFCSYASFANIYSKINFKAKNASV